MFVITDEKKAEGITLKRFIEERRLLKTKVKLLHILLLDDDILSLEKEGYTISSLTLDDLYLTEDAHFIAPIKNRIVTSKENNLKLKTYLIYLSYLYNLDFFKIYQEDAKTLWELISKLHISKNIKDNLYLLICNNEGEYFSRYLEELNNPEYRGALRDDKLILQRSVNL